MRENELVTSLGFHSKSLREFAKQALRNPFRANQTGSGMFHQIVKEQVLPGQQEGVQTNANYIEPRPQSQLKLKRKLSERIRLKQTAIPSGILPHGYMYLQSIAAPSRTFCRQRFS
jgi:hypothetical protein